MRSRITTIPTLLVWATLILACGGTPATASHRSEFDLRVLVDGVSRPEYRSSGTVYIEALRGREFTLRITNPTPYRVAVALSVDGLNTIDARHSDAWSASKWVLAPWETTEISGWQVNEQTARRFYFTGERDSYGAALGKTENLGVIEAVFFRERVPEVEPYLEEDRKEPSRQKREGKLDASSPAPSAAAESGARAQKDSADDYAATGMGDRTRHNVQRVHLELERTPVASMRIRYEFRPMLVELGVLPETPSRLHRRERAQGFDSYCPEP